MDYDGKRLLYTVEFRPHHGHVVFSVTELISLACVPVLMVLASICENRFGPAAAGVIASAPITAGIGIVAVSSTMGAAAGRDMALRMGGYSPAQIGLALVVAWSASRWGVARALFAGTACYAGLAWLAAIAPPPAAVAAGVLALAAGLKLMPAAAARADQPVGKPDNSATPGAIAVRALVALAATGALLISARVFGPAVGGAVGAFPVFTATLCIFVYKKSGVSGLRATLHGLLRGLPGYITFVLVYWAAAGALDPAMGVAAAALACLGIYAASSIRPQRGRPDGKRTDHTASTDSCITPNPLAPAPEHDAAAPARPAPTRPTRRPRRRDAAAGPRPPGSPASHH